MINGPDSGGGSAGRSKKMQAKTVKALESMLPAMFAAEAMKQMIAVAYVRENSTDVDGPDPKDLAAFAWRFSDAMMEQHQRRQS